MEAAAEADHTDLANSMLDPWSRALGLRFTRVTLDAIEAEIALGPQHLQGFGIVHGGVYASVVETLCSVGAGVTSLPRGMSVAGLENHTTFLRAVRGGTLRACATPLTRGRRTQVWETTITGEDGKLVAKGSVRLICLPLGSDLAGAPIELPPHG